MSVRTRRYYESELGLRGALIALLSARLPLNIVSSDTIIEQEHQKRLADHGLYAHKHPRGRVATCAKQHDKP